MLTFAEPVITLPTTSRTRASRDWVIAAIVGSVPVALSIVLAVAGHAWGIARTDDWAFARIAITLHRTGHFQLIGWSQMNLVGLVAWAQPFLWIFGDHMWVLDVSGAVLVGLGLAASYRVARALLAPTAAVLAVAATAVFPGFLRDMSTFMTDAPGFAVQAIVLALGIEALSSTGRRRGLLLAAVLVVGCWGFSIREFAIAAPLAVLAAAYLGADRQRRRGVAVTAAGFIASCAALYLWRTGLPGAQHLNGRPGLTVASVISVRAVCTTCLGLVPVLAWTARAWWHPVARRARTWGCAVGGTAVLLAIFASHSAQHMLSGAYLDPQGVNGALDLLGVRPTLLPQPVWAGLTLLAVASAVVIMGLLAEWIVARPQITVGGRVLGLHVAAMSAALGSAALLNGLVFDRYIWPIVLSGSILLLNRYRLTESRRTPLALIPLVLAALLAIALAANSAAYDGAESQAAKSLTRQGLAAQGIDAGFEWAGAHATGMTTPYGQSVQAGFTWWLSWFPHPEICAVVTSSPVRLPGFVPAGTQAWDLVLVAVPEKLSVYRSTSPTCPAAR